MSCWETSEFINDPEKVDRNIMIEACSRLGWKFNQINGKLVINDAKQGSTLYGESAIEIVGNRIRYNDYYMRNGAEKINELQYEYMCLYVSHIEETIKEKFRSVGYNILPNNRFVAKETQVSSFFVVARSKLQDSKGVEARIKFTILKDGSIESDSNYIPDDIHILANEAMSSLQKIIDCKRIVSKKPRHLIPSKHKVKVKSIKTIQTIKKR